MMLKIVIPLTSDDNQDTVEISPTVRERLESRRFCRSPEALRERASESSPVGHVTSPSARAAKEKAKSHNDAVEKRMKRRRSHEEEAKQKLLTKNAEAEDRARQHLDFVKQKAKTHNEAISERVSRKLFFDASQRESLARKITIDMEEAEQRRTRRVQSIVQRNAMRASAVSSTSRAAKVKQEEKAHALSALLAATKASDMKETARDARDACASLLAQIEARLGPKPGDASQDHSSGEGGGEDFEALTAWMRSTQTIDLVKQSLESLGAGPSPPQRKDSSRLVIALLCMAIDEKVRLKYGGKLESTKPY